MTTSNLQHTNEGLSPVDAQQKASYISFRSDIQGLRAVSVMSVITFHYFPSWLQGGFVGVDVFFVISGFLISSIILNEVKGGKFRISLFYGRRIRRLFPALTSILICSFIYGWFFVFPQNYINLARESLSASLFAANIFFYFNSDYFASDASNSPLLHLWSLGVEEQFYIVFPLLCIFTSRLSKKSAYVVLLLVFVASLTINVVAVTKDPMLDFYMPFNRFWEFLVGTLIAYASNSKEKVHGCLSSNTLLCDLSSAIGIILMLISVGFIKPTYGFPGAWALLPTAGAALLIASGDSNFISRRILSSRPFVFIGTISYPLYLWHWVILIFAKQLFLVGNFRLVVKISLILASLLVSVITYYMLERPLSRIRARGCISRVTYACLFVMALLIIFALGDIATNGYTSRFSAQIVSLDHNYVNDEKQSSFNYGTCFLDVNQPPSNFSGSCLNINKVTHPAKAIFIWGDSHSADLVPGLITSIGSAPIRLSEFTASSCPPVLNFDAPQRPMCRIDNSFIFDIIKSQMPDEIILSADWDLSVAGYTKLDETIRLLKANGIRRIFVIGPAPHWDAPVVGVLENELRRAPNSTPSNYLPRSELDTPFMDEKNLQKTAVAAGADYISLTAFLCDESGCLVKTGQGWQNIITYDVAHFTIRGSTYVVSHIFQKLVTIGTDF